MTHSEIVGATGWEFKISPTEAKLHGQLLNSKGPCWYRTTTIIPAQYQEKRRRSEMTFVRQLPLSFLFFYCRSAVTRSWQTMTPSSAGWTTRKSTSTLAASSVVESSLQLPESRSTRCAVAVVAPRSFPVASLPSCRRPRWRRTRSNAWSSR